MLAENMAVKQKRARAWLAVTGGVLAVALIGGVAFATGASPQHQARELAVDPVIQGIVERAVTESVKEWDASMGFAVVADPSTGKVLALSKVDRVGSTDRLVTTRTDVLSEIVEPGSIMKPFWLGFGVDEGRVGVSDVIDAGNGRYQVGKRIHYDWKKSGFGKISAAEVIVHSSNIGAIKIAQLLGEDEVRRGLEALGFGEGGSSKDFADAVPGRYPALSDDEKDQFLPSVAGGYSGFKVSPIEIVQAYSAIANGGKLYRPRELTEPGDEPRLVRRVFSPATAEVLRGVLERVVREGTGSQARNPFYSTAGKTGTVTKVDSRIAGSYLPDRKDMAHFVGFAPVRDPRVVIYAVLDEPRGRGHGNQHCGPIFNKIAEQTLRYLGVAPDQPAR